MPMDSTRKKSLWSELGGGGYQWSEKSVESEGEIASVGSTLTKLAGEGKRKCRTNQNLLVHCGVGPGGGEEEVAGPAVRERA